MAYMRGENYIYRSGSDVLQFYTPDLSGTLPMDVAEDLALMIVGQIIDEDRLEAVMKRVALQYGGNIGADAIMKACGLPTVMEQVRREIEGDVLLPDDGPERAIP